MKKYLAVVLMLGIYQNWGSISNFFAGSSDHQPVATGVVLYATAWCGYCQKTRELFAEHGIDYVEYDIEKSDVAYQQFQRLGGRGVPVVSANGTVVHGYSPQRILAAATSN